MLKNKIMLIIVTILAVCLTLGCQKKANLNYDDMVEVDVTANLSNITPIHNNYKITSFKVYVTEDEKAAVLKQGSRYDFKIGTYAEVTESAYDRDSKTEVNLLGYLSSFKSRKVLAGDIVLQNLYVSFISKMNRENRSFDIDKVTLDSVFISKKYEYKYGKIYLGAGRWKPYMKLEKNCNWSPVVLYKVDGRTTYDVVTLDNVANQDGNIEKYAEHFYDSAYIKSKTIQAYQSGKSIIVEKAEFAK